jgi:hypothetical protein
MVSTLAASHIRARKLNRYSINNLVFTGLRETAGEETEAKLRDFLRCELNIDYYIEFDTFIPKSYLIALLLSEHSPVNTRCK